MSGTLAFVGSGIRNTSDEMSTVVSVKQRNKNNNKKNTAKRTKQRVELNPGTYSSPASRRSRRHSRPRSCTARGCRCSGCCRSGSGTASHTGCPLRIHESGPQKPSLQVHQSQQQLCWGVCVRVCVNSYSTSEAPRLNCLRSRCRRRISSEAARTRGSCTQTGKGGSRCRWGSGSLRGQNQPVKFSHRHRGLKSV